MMRVRWGIDATVIDDFDRDSQPTPYTGPLPPANQVYRFRLRIFRHVPAVEDKNPQLRVGLELAPHTREHKRYKGFFVQDFVPVAENTAFRYVKYLDALGISARAFINGPYTVDDDGNIRRIGRWLNKGTIYVLAQLRSSDNDNYPRDVGAVMAYEPDDDDDDDDDDESAETEWNDDSDDDDDDEIEEQPRARRRTGKQQVSTGRTRKTKTTRSRRRAVSDDDDDEF